MQLISDQSLALIIDDQIRLLPSIADGELMMRNTGILIQGLRILDIPMLITQQYTKGLGMSDPSIYLHTGTMEYLEKRTFSCWKDDTIRRRIETSGRRQIILFGIEAHICVLQTALDLVHAGYETILVTDCTSSRRLSDKGTALQRMIQEGISVTTYESLLFELMETSLHPHFRDISALIK